MPASPAGPGSDEFRVDELARRTGMTVRNIREHQSRGLLQPPRLVGRVGYYNAEHVTRVELVKQLQADGFTLESIRRMLRRSGGGMLGFATAVLGAFDAEPAREVDVAELAASWGRADPALLDRAVELGLLRRTADGGYEDPSPRLTSVGAELVALGVPPERALEAAGAGLAHATRIADGFVRLYLDTYWEPFEAAGWPEERWPELVALLDRLRPLAFEAALALFDRAIQAAVTAAINRHQDERPD